jgi:hypothetical protein
MTTQKTKKTENIYNCNLCDYNTSKRTDYNRHILTQKHKNNVLTTQNNAKNEKIYICICCEKSYNDRAGLWRHKKICKANKTDTNYEEISDKNLIMMLIKQNSELLEVIKNGTHNHNNNNNSNNKTFNLNLFLNETCKDAMNIMDFAEKIKLQLTDLEKVGEVGYVEGISNIITTNLKALDVTQRPVHCTDKKRETIYVKDENKWEKEDDNKTKLRKVIKNVANKNIRLIPQFREKYPDYKNSSSKVSDKYDKMVIEAMGGPGDNDIDKENKIIHNISKSVVIDKCNHENMEIT